LADASLPGGTEIGIMSLMRQAIEDNWISSSISQRHAPGS
jgi:hypothetical protein